MNTDTLVSSLAAVFSNEPEIAEESVRAAARAVSAAMVNRYAWRKEILDIVSGRKGKLPEEDLGRLNTNTLGSGS